MRNDPVAHDRSLPRKVRGIFDSAFAEPVLSASKASVKAPPGFLPRTCRRDGAGRIACHVVLWVCRRRRSRSEPRPLPALPALGRRHTWQSACPACTGPQAHVDGQSRGHGAAGTCDGRPAPDAVEGPGSRRHTRRSARGRHSRCPPPIQAPIVCRLYARNDVVRAWVLE